MSRSMPVVVAIAIAVLAGAVAAASVVTATPIASGTSDVQAIAATAPPTSPPRLIGFSITEDAGSAAVARVRIHHGTSTAGAELFDVELSADQSTREWFPPGLDVPNGVFVDRVSGTARLTLYSVTP